MRYTIPVEVVVEASSEAHALEQAKKLRELLADPLVQSSVRAEGIAPVGIVVRPPTPASTNGAAPRVTTP